ncbi:MAG: hypothetical protein F7B60_04230 [Desulfurococcales archaeon]|nr:hypothetical protein [Desulfurococcales archaeon]
MRNRVQGKLVREKYGIIIRNKVVFEMTPTEELGILQSSKVGELEEKLKEYESHLTILNQKLTKVKETLSKLLEEL